MTDETNLTSPSAPEVTAEESHRLNPEAYEDHHASVAHHDRPSRIEHPLYISHALLTWNSRLFEFGAFLFLESIYPSTLLPASVYALARSASAAVLSPWAGYLIDNNDRLAVIRFSIAGQRVSTLLSCIIFIFVLRSERGGGPVAGSSLALTGLSILACVEKFCIVVNTISIEKDWVVVIAGKDETSLSRLNAVMRRIDLFCKLVAPLAVSFIDTYSTMVAISFTGALSTVSCIVEYFAILRVYKAVPELADRLQSTTTMVLSAQGFASAVWSATKTFIDSPVILPSVALSLLYLTSLSFAGQLITYLLAPPTSLSALLLSILRGVAACSELSATFIAPRLISQIGLVRAGSWAINGQLIFTSIAAASLWTTGSLSIHGRTTMLVSSIILSRLGLWSFDLAIQQQVQDAVPEQSRGAFSSVEAATQNLFEMISFATTTIWTKPEEFRYPGAISAVAVAVAAALYAAFVRERRGHLFHLEQGLCGSKYWESHFGKAVPEVTDDEQPLLSEDARVSHDNSSNRAINTHP